MGVFKGKLLLSVFGGGGVGGGFGESPIFSLIGGGGFTTGGANGTDKRDFCCSTMTD